MTLLNNKNRRPVSLVIAVTMSATLLLAGCTKAQEPPSQETESPAPVDPDYEARPPEIKDKPQETPATTDSQTPEPVKEDITDGPDVTEKEAVEDEYFEDAAFMGNSLMDGFRMFSGITTCDYYAATSMTVVGATSKNIVTLDSGNAGTMVDGLIQKPYGKIYILLGINEIGFETQTFKEMYGEMLDTIITAQQECDIYIMGLTPVSYAKSSSSDIFNMTRITEYNEALRDLAEEKDCYYMNLVEALAGEDGFLPSSETTDGVHLSGALYNQWANYVRTHYAD